MADNLRYWSCKIEKYFILVAMQREFTATVFIVQDEKVLLIFHKKLQKWLPPGGHLEEGELPSEGAIREAHEETGLKISLIAQENVWVEERKNGKSIPRPYMCLLENIPQLGENPPHQHIDLIYVGQPIAGEMQINKEETEALRWFSLEELEALVIGEAIFEDTVHAVRHILSSFIPAYS